MVVSRKRMQKLVKIVAIAGLLVFLLTHAGSYFSPDMSVDQYAGALKEYVDKYKEDHEKAVVDDKTVGSGDEVGAGAGAGIGSKPVSNGKTEGSGSSGKNSKVSSSSGERELLKSFFGRAFQYVKEYGPEGVNTPDYDPNCNLKGDIGYRKDNVNEWWKLTGKELSNCLKLTKKQIAMLKDGHTNYVRAINEMKLPANAYSGDGIVTVGGGKFSIMAFLIIKTVRNFGTTLPVEVFIPPNDEGDDEFCNVLLPKYNAKCIYLSDVLPDDVIQKTEFKGYQFKSLAMIASSFRNLLLLDADNFPIKPLDNIFDEKVYKENGLVLWPDFWRRTTHPVYYDIANIPLSYQRVRNTMDDVTPPSVYTQDLSDLSKVPLHDLEGTIPDASTESGQMMINKVQHIRTVLLSLYYNAYGPSWYYSIFSQRSSGEGDKETFIAAANHYGLPFYQVRSEPTVDGYHKANGEGFRGVCMLQHDFAQDYDRYLLAQKEIKQKYANKPASYDPDYKYQESYLEKYFSVDSADVMFVHSHLPKFDPVGLALTKDLIENGKHIRSYRNLQRMHGYDLELEAFKTFKEYVCKTRVHFKYFEKAVKSESEWTTICNYVDERLQYLKQSHADALEGKF